MFDGLCVAPLTYVKLLVYGGCLRNAAPCSFILFAFSPVPSSLTARITVHFNNEL